MLSGSPGTAGAGSTARSALEILEQPGAYGGVAGALRAAFPLVLRDVEQAFGRPFPPHWTDRDILAHGLRSDSGLLPTLLLDLYALYEPVRYGQERDRVAGDPVALARRVYSETPLARRPGPVAATGFRTAFSGQRTGAPPASPGAGRPP